LIRDMKTFVPWTRSSATSEPVELWTSSTARSMGRLDTLNRADRLHDREPVSVHPEVADLAVSYLVPGAGRRLPPAARRSYPTELALVGCGSAVSAGLRIQKVARSGVGRLAPLAELQSSGLGETREVGAFVAKDLNVEKVSLVNPEQHANLIAAWIDSVRIARHSVSDVGGGQRSIRR